MSVPKVVFTLEEKMINCLQCCSKTNSHRIASQLSMSFNRPYFVIIIHFLSFQSLWTYSRVWKLSILITNNVIKRQGVILPKRDAAALVD